ncbi:DUF1173 family protein [Methylomonas sp. UP202]|uniref:DUF1173 family protein n=1 Tax=Methylomonas sp. UP202 TaxID=3040943 RepID=UPI00247954C7|nr:DUF1173 family protein [Methylomonas sp. UP202]WGS83927.1 DUF1173 family protein [Methylomonas sp. UP202]
MSHYRVGTIEFTEDHGHLQTILKQAYANQQRPLCLCTAQGVELYIAFAYDRYWLKRMPHSGERHHPGCDSYEPPAELSGLGQVYGSAIKDNFDTGITQLKFDFRLAPGKSRMPVAPVEGEEATKPTSIKASEAKLGLRGLLHYLWEQSGWQRWTPAADSRRNWYGLRKALLEACAGKVAKTTALDRLVFIPETFSLDKKDEINARIAKDLAYSDNLNRFRVLIGELKEVKPARFGQKLIIKHLPEYPFYLSDQTYKRVLKQFDTEWLLWRGNEASRLMVIATFSIRLGGYPEIDQLSLMNVSSQWIPFETADELALIEYLVAEGRSFSKCLRYNLARSKPLAAAVLVDTDTPSAVYVVDTAAHEESTAALRDIIAESRTPSLIWDPLQPALCEV